MIRSNTFLTLLLALGLAVVASPALAGSAGSGGVTLGDFDGDGDTDIAFRNSATNQVFIWLVENQAFQIGGGFNASGDWQIRLVGKFDNNDTDDIVIYNTVTQQTGIWLMNGRQLAGFRLVGTTGSGVPVAAGDFNDDGNTDLVLQGPSATTGFQDISIWLLNASSTFLGGGFVGKQPDGTTVLAVGQYDNGDTNPDISLFRGGLGPGGVDQVGFWRLGGANGTTIQNGNGFNLAANVVPLNAAADFDGDGQDDILTQDTSNDQVRVFLINNVKIGGNQFTGTAAGATPVGLGEFSDTPGDPDLLLEVTGGGNVSIWQLLAGAFSAGDLIGNPGSTNWRVANLGQP